MGDAHGFFEWMGVSEIAGTWASGRVHNLQELGQGAGAGITDGRTIFPSPRAQTGCGRVTGMSFLR